MNLDCRIQSLLITRIKIDFPEFTVEDYCREVSEIYRMVICRALITNEVEWEKQKARVDELVAGTTSKADPNTL